jgi:hypothetical protein
MSSADPTPIPSARFATALKELSVEMLHLKVLEIRNSIAHLQYSNDQLKPFAEGTSVAAAASDGAPNTTTSQPPAEPDQDCIDAIRENEQVIDRMAERIALIRIEVEERGVSWTEFQSKDEVDERQRQQQQQQQDNPASDAAHSNSSDGQVNGGSHGSEQQQQQHSAWADGTFQTGTIRNGQVQFDAQPGRPQGGTLSDEQLRQALEQRMRELNPDDADDADGGMHL